MLLEQLPLPLRTFIDPHREGHRRRRMSQAEADVAVAELVTMAVVAAVLVAAQEVLVVLIEEAVEEGDTTTDLVPVLAVRLV